MGLCNSFTEGAQMQDDNYFQDRGEDPEKYFEKSGKLYYKLLFYCLYVLCK